MGIFGATCIGAGAEGEAFLRFAGMACDYSTSDRGAIAVDRPPTAANRVQAAKFRAKTACNCVIILSAERQLIRGQQGPAPQRFEGTCMGSCKTKARRQRCRDRRRLRRDRAA